MPNRISTNTGNAACLGLALNALHEERATAWPPSLPEAVRTYLGTRLHRDMQVWDFAAALAGDDGHRRSLD